MGLIKYSNVPTSAAPFSMRDIENQARGILLHAREQAEALLAEAQQEGEHLKAQAYAAGLEEGRRDGRKQGELEGAKAGAQQALAEHQEQLSALVNALSTGAAQLDSARRELEAAGLSEVVSLATAIARRVTKRQGMIDPIVLTENLKESMTLVCHAADVRVAIHPNQKATLESALPALKLAFPKLSHVELIEDATISAGGCRVFTARGNVDGDLDAQLDRVVADLLPSQAEATSG
jgi:flagellar assembly protein FliH